MCSPASAFNPRDERITGLEALVVMKDERTAELEKNCHSPLPEAPDAGQRSQTIDVPVLKAHVGAIGRELLDSVTSIFGHWHALTNGTLTRGEFGELMAPVRLRVGSLFGGGGEVVRVGLVRGHRRAPRGALDLRGQRGRRAHQQPRRGRTAGLRPLAQAQLRDAASEGHGPGRLDGFREGSRRLDTLSAVREDLGAALELENAALRSQVSHLVESVARLNEMEE